MSRFRGGPVVVLTLLMSLLPVMLGRYPLMSAFPVADVSLTPMALLQSSLIYAKESG